MLLVWHLDIMYFNVSPLFCFLTHFLAFFFPLSKQAYYLLLDNVVCTLKHIHIVFPGSSLRF